MRVDADVAPPGRFPSQRLGQFGRIGEGLAEDEPAPAQLELDIGCHPADQVRRGGFVQAECDRLGIVVRRNAAGHGPLSTHFGRGSTSPDAQSPNWSSMMPSQICAASIATFSLMKACWVPVYISRN